MFAYKLIDGTSQLWPHALRIMNMAFVVQFNVYMCLIEVDRYISHTEDMFLDIHFRINEPNFVSVHLMNFCEFRHLRVGQNLWISSFQCKNDDCVDGGHGVAL